ncbi:RCC1 domain-containing protein [Mariniflexile maritimum]|uniref:RCC1 domain-containing protein n=1 Tax=Mariniflexile maritimum TaxID=2682493 RepID=UPI0012F7015F|nr:T9SS type A sorting domain-containing protein [Mariniflexile maritimum]
MQRNYILLFLFLNYSLIFGQCWTTIDAGFSHTLGISNDGHLWAWGLNSNGQLGDGTNTNKNNPIQITTDNDWKSISAETNHTVALKTNKTLWAWGNNVHGQIGDGTNINKNIPTQIGTDNNWEILSTGGGDHTFAIKTDGTLWGWGDNSYGQLGDNTNESKNTPTQIGNSTNWDIISIGADHTVAIKTDGTLWAWGKNNFGQLGDGTFTDKNAPVQIGSDTNWEYISSSNNHTVAKKSNGTLWAWGLNNNGQIGDGTSTDKNTPTQIGSDNNWQSAVAGGGHTIGIKMDGSLWAWGLNNAGQLGNGTSTNYGVPNPSPIQITASYNWQNIFVGGNHSLAINSDNNIFAFGNNFSGQYGDGTNVSENTPTLVNCSTLSIVDLNHNSFVYQIYPNPTHDWLHISSSQPIASISISELTGKTVLKQSGNIKSLNIEQFQGGVYIITLFINGKEYQNKFIKI